MARILLIDDDNAIGDVFSTMLQWRGHVLHRAETGDEGVANAKSFAPDVILLDVVLPDVNGLELLPKLHASAPDAPVIVITGSSDRTHVRAALQGGAYDYLCKFDVPTLLNDAVSRAVGHGQLLRERRRLADENAAQKRELARLVSERTQELNTTRERLDDLLDNASELIQSTDLDGRFRYVNRYWLEVLGYSREETTQALTVWEVMDPSDHGDFRQIVDRLQSGSRRERLETVLIARSGKRVEVVGAINLHTDRCETCVRAILLDVTEQNRTARAVEASRQQAERELLEERGRLASEVEEQSTRLARAYQALQGEAENRERAEHAAREAASELDAIFHTAAGGFRVLDADFNVLRANRTIEHLVGIPTSQMVGRKCWETFPGSACQTARCSVRRVLSGEIITDEETTKSPLTRGDVSCLLNARPLRWQDGRIEAILEEFRDLTEVKRLREVAEAVSLAENVAYVVSGIRHELGNPVNSIKTTLAVLRSRLARLDHQGIVDYLDRASKDVGQMEFILRSLRSLHMFDHLNLTRVRLSEFMGGFRRLVARDLDPISFEVRLKTDAVVEVDPSALQQVLINLVNNARDSLADRDDGVVSAIIDRQDSLVRLVVRDNGCGMSHQQLADLFKPFRTNKRHGTGLGLTIVRKVLAKMRGTIEVTSVHGVGTTVTVLLPTASVE